MRGVVILLGAALLASACAAGTVDRLDLAATPEEPAPEEHGEPAKPEAASQ